MLDYSRINVRVDLDSHLNKVTAIECRRDNLPAVSSNAPKQLVESALVKSTKS
ncbi:MAG: hypothetical protein GKR91_07785 [Pseudomonadales bacterium]|nr:hypothetical protein [Pseudomonadales bacterium]